MAESSELIEDFLIGPSDQQVDSNLIELNVVISGEPQAASFSTNFKQFIRDNAWITPITGPHFYTYFFIGSILSLPYSNLLVKHRVGKFLLKVGGDGLLKCVFASIRHEILTLSFRAVSITNEELDEITDMSNYAFTDTELTEIIHHFQISPHVLQQLALDFKIFKTFKSLRTKDLFSSLWASIDGQQLGSDLVRLCNLAQSGISSSEFVYTRHFSGMHEKSFIDLLSSMRSQLISPESTANCVTTLISHAKILYHSFMDSTGALNSVEEFSGFTAGMLSMNFHKTYSLKLLIGASLDYSLDIYFEPKSFTDYDVKLKVPCRIFFINSIHMSQPIHESTIQNFGGLEYYAHVLTDRKYSVMTVADLRPLLHTDTVRSAVLPINAPLVNKILTMVDSEDSIYLQYSTSAIRHEIDIIMGKLATNDEDTLFNYFVGQLLSIKPASGNIRLHLLFAYANQELNDNVRSIITISNHHAVFINVIKNIHLQNVQQFISDRSRRKNIQMGSQNIIHIDVVPATRQVNVIIPINNGQGQSYMGIVHSIGDVDVEDIVSQMKDNNVHMVDEVLSYALRDFRPYLSSMQLTMAFLKGLLSNKYTILHSPVFINRLAILEDSRTAAISNELLEEWLFIIHHTETVPEHTISVIVFTSKVSETGDHFVEPTMIFQVSIDHSSTDGHFIKLSAPFVEVQSEEHLPSVEPSCSKRVKRGPTEFCSAIEEALDISDEDGKVSNNKVETFIRTQPSHKLKKLLRFFSANKIELAKHITGLYATEALQVMRKLQVLQKLTTLAQYSNHLTLGIIYKNMAVDLYNGNYAGVVFSGGFLALDYGASKTVDMLSKSGTMMSGSSHLSKLYRTSRPFLRRFASAFNLYSFCSSLKSYAQYKDTPSAVSLAESGTFLFVDATSIGLELASMDAALSIAGPIGAIVAGFVFVTAESYLLHEKLKTYDKLLHLDGVDKFINGIHAFLTGDVEPVLQDEANEKVMNNQMARLISDFMLRNPSVAVYASPSYITLADGTRLCDDNVMFFDKKINTTWSKTKPDTNSLSSDIDLLCFTSVTSEAQELQDEETFLDRLKNKVANFFWPKSGKLALKESYYCDDSMALKRKIVHKDPIAWIDVKKGTDLVRGFPHMRHVFIIGDGEKTIYANNLENILIFNGNDTKGYVELHGKQSLADFTSYSAANKGIMNFTMLGTDLHVHDSTLNITRISRIYGRLFLSDQFVASCYSTYFNGKSGTSLQVDYIHIPDEFCYYNFAVVAGSFTYVLNEAPYGSFKYFLEEDFDGAEIKIGSNVDSKHEIILQNVTLVSIGGMKFEQQNQCLNLLKNKTSNRAVSCIICNKNWASTRLHFSDGFTLLLESNGYMHAVAKFKDNPDTLINKYARHARRLNVEMNLRSLYDNSSIIISCRKESLKSNSNITDTHFATVLENNPNEISHLVAGSIENLFILDVNETLPISPIYIHVLDENVAKIVLDLRQLLRFYDGDSVLQKNVHYTVKAVDENVVLELLNHRSRFCRIILRKATKFTVMEKFSIVLRNPMFLQTAGRYPEYFRLVPEPIHIDPQDSNSVTVIDKNHMEEGLMIKIKGCYIDHEIFDHRKNMIVLLRVNGVRDITNAEEMFIVFRSFYDRKEEEWFDFSIEFLACDEKKLKFTKTNTKRGTQTSLDNRIKAVGSDLQKGMKLLRRENFYSYEFVL